MLFFFCLSVHVFCSVYHAGFYMAYLVIRRMCLIVLLTADPFFCGLQP